MNNPLELYDKFEPSFALIVQGYNLFDSYQTKKHRERVTSFHRAILDGKATDEKIAYEIENIKVHQDDYYILLKNSVEDEEKEKSYIYGNIYRYIRNNQHINQDIKRFLIRSAKELPYSSIKLIPELYIYKNFHTKNISFKKFTDELYSKRTYDLKWLDQLSIISLPTGMIFDGGISLNNDNFKYIIESFFNHDELLPSKYNIDIWEYRKVLILTNKNTDESIEIQKISKILDKFNIPCKTMELFSSSLSHDYTDFIIIKHQKIGSNISEEVDSFTTNHKIIEVTSTYPKELIKNTSYLNLNDENDIEKLKKEFSE